MSGVQRMQPTQFEYVSGNGMLRNVLTESDS